jgi:hypothetical protein
MNDSPSDIADHIIDEAQMVLGSNGEVRLFFPGGPVDPVLIEYSTTGKYVHLELRDGGRITVAATAIVGWQELNSSDEE